MDTRKISREMRNNIHTAQHYLGTFPADKLPPRPSKNTCFISNTDPHTKPGQHWVAVYVDNRGTPYYFDPYGLPPITAYHLEFLNGAPRGRWFFNTKQVQSTRSKNCGKHCINFLKRSCRTKDPKGVVTFYASCSVQLTDRTLNRGLGIVSRMAADVNR